MAMVRLHRALLLALLVAAGGTADDVAGRNTSVGSVPDAVLDEGSYSIFERLSAVQLESMRSLFTQLDSNQDGVLQFEEFRGMTFAAWAAFYTLSVDMFALQEGKDMMQELLNLTKVLPERILNAVPPWLRLARRPEGRTLFSWVCRYAGCLFCVQLVIVVFEYVRDALGLYRWSLPAEPLPLDQIKEADRELVLEYDTPWRKSHYETLKILFMTLSGWALLRFIWAFSSFAIAVLMINIAALRETALWRSFWWRTAQFFIFNFLGGLGFFKVRIRGTLAPKDCKLLLGNHIGVFELIALYGLAFPSFVSRSSNMNLPLFNGIVVASDAILVDRDNPDSKEYTMKAISEFANDPNGRQLMVFPEGTCNNQKSIFRFNKGAFTTGRNAVQLVAFKFPYRHFNPCYTGVAVDGHEFWDLMWRSCCQFVQHMEVKFLPPYMPTDAEVAEPEVFASHMQKVMAAHLHSTINNYTFKLYREVHSEYLKAQLKQREGRRLKQLLEDASCLRRGGRSASAREKES